MSPSSRPTFGVEFEFATPSINPGVKLPDPSEKRALRLPNDYGDIEEGYSYSRKQTTWEFVAEHIAATLTEAGHPTTVEVNDFTTWDITIDCSIRYPEDVDEAYTWHRIEIRSPAFYFNPDSLRAVADVCAILTSTYCIHTNGSTGLHVHVGNGEQGFPFATVRNLVAFLWAFEPQLSSLHPQRRFDGPYCQSMRENSHLKASDSPTGALAAVKTLLRCESIAQLCDLLYTLALGNNAYSFDDLFTFMEFGDRVNVKPTIEFRQHEGTLDAEAVTNWIKTVVGIVNFVDNAPQGDIAALLSIAEYEHWQKLGDGYDGRREQRLGPVVAEKGFTVIDLLKTIGLFSPALYYKRYGIHRVGTEAMSNMASDSPIQISSNGSLENPYYGVLATNTGEFEEQQAALRKEMEEMGIAARKSISSCQSNLLGMIDGQDLNDHQKSRDGEALHDIHEAPHERAGSGIWPENKANVQGYFQSRPLDLLT